MPRRALGFIACALLLTWGARELIIQNLGSTALPPTQALAKPSISPTQGQLTATPRPPPLPIAPLLRATRLANTDPAAALAFAGQLSDPAIREACHETIAIEISRNDPLHAIEIAATLLPDLRAEATIAHAARNWAAKSPAEAATWAAEIETDSLRETIMRAIAGELAETNPHAAAELIELTTASQTRTQAIALILHRWSLKSPSAAQTWKPLHAINE